MDQIKTDSLITTETKDNRIPRRPKIIKRYGNRKLYDTDESTYVVLNDIAKMICKEEDVRVIDNETKNDITVFTLTQIIFGAEKKSNVSPPIDILKRIIKEGDGSFSSFLSKLGLFKAENHRKDHQRFSAFSKSSLLEDQKRNKPEQSQTTEQKIASLTNSPEENSEVIPHLPGSNL